MANKENELLKFKAKHIRTLYPQPFSDKKIGDNDDYYGVMIWEVVEEDKNNSKFLLKDYKGEIKITGEYIVEVKSNTTYNFLIKEVEHPKYGLQNQIVYYNEDVDFKNLNNQRGFLKTILKESQLNGLFDLYENPIEIISNHDREALMKVKGIGSYIADRIIRDFEKTKDMSMVYADLDNLGLTTSFINKIIAHYKDPQKVIGVCKNNPYQLIQDIEGVGFLTADKVALSGGMSPKDTKRLKAFILNYLEEQGQAGHSYVTARELNTNLFEVLGPQEDVLEYFDENDKSNNNLNNAIKELEEEKKIKLEFKEKGKSERRVYLIKYYNLEKNIAKHLKRLLKGKSYFKFENIDEKIKIAEENQGFEFTDEQKEGIKLGLDNQVCLITGSAGSGKSSLVTGILSVLDNYTFAQTALSGQAAARMQEITGKKGQTIHRLLSYDPKSKGFCYNEKNPLNYDIIILDEISLVGGEIFLDLLKAIPTGAKFYMLGDPGQLEAIGPLNLAADMIESKSIPTVELTKVHRQAQKSGILTTAYDVRGQIQIVDSYTFEGTEVRGELKDMVLEITSNKDKDQDLVLAYFKKYFKSDLVNEDIMKIQVISPIKERGDCCVYHLNNLIQDYANPRDKYKKCHLIKKRKDENDNDYSFEIREGDKIMCMKNNYHASVSLYDDTETAIFNGWTGIIKEITEIYVAINFPLASFEIVYLPIDQIGNYITLGYCSTCHKLQGSSADVIIGVIDYCTPPKMLTKQLVYTLLTRAKKLCVLVAQNTALRKAISTNFVSEKRTFLGEFLEK